MVKTKPRRKQFGAPKKKGGDKNRRRRRSLEDLYHSSVTADKNKKRKSSKKEPRENIVNEEAQDLRLVIEESCKPIEKNDVSALLRLLNEDHKETNSSEENDINDINDADDEYCSDNDHSDEGHSCDSASDNDHGESNHSEEAHSDDDHGSLVVKMNDGSNSESDVSREEDGKIDDQREEDLRIEETEDDENDEMESNTDEEESVELESWEGFNLDSFNNVIPEDALIDTSSDDQVSKKAIVVQPPGFQPFLVAPRTCNVVQLVNSLPQEPVDLIGKTGEARIVMSESNGRSENDDARILNIDQKVWTRWKSLVVPKILEQERRWLELSEINKTEKSSSSESYLKSIQATTFFGLLSHYVDVTMSGQTYLNSAVLRGLSALHVVNHLMRMRKRQVKNNRLLKEMVEQHQTARNESRQPKNDHQKKKQELLKLQQELQTQKTNNEKTNNVTTSTSLDPTGDDRFRDHGFTRAKVLIVAPTKQIAKDFIELILDLLPGAKQVKNRKRFEREFNVEDCTSPEDRLRECSGETLLQKRKPVDFVELFRGNASDQFRIGMRLHQSSVTLFSPLYQSDVIIASPLGLRLVIGTEGLEKREFDFLSSIEVLLVDRGDVLRMQNWEHVRDLFDVLNRLPTTMRSECDIRRLRPGYIQGMARQLRQTIILSCGRRPEINSLFSSSLFSSIMPVAALDVANSRSSFCANFRGIAKLGLSSSGNPIANGALKVNKQLFFFLPCKSISDLSQTLWNFMARQFPPPFLPTSLSDSILLIVFSYVEFLQVRKILKASPLAAQDLRNFSRFVACHEYTSNPNLTKARQAFLKGKVKLMIATERFLFYRRYLLKGASHVLFLGCPEHPEIYLDCLNGLRDPSVGISCVVYTPFHTPAAERLVGATKLKTLLNGNASTSSKLFVLD